MKTKLIVVGIACALLGALFGTQIINKIKGR